MTDPYEGMTYKTICLALVNAAFGLEKCGQTRLAEDFWKNAIWWAERGQEELPI